jgi:hypothetical protein
MVFRHDHNDLSVQSASTAVTLSKPVPAGTHSSLRLCFHCTPTRNIETAGLVASPLGNCPFYATHVVAGLRKCRMVGSCGVVGQTFWGIRPLDAAGGIHATLFPGAGESF